MNELTNQQLLEYITRIMTADGTEKEISNLVHLLKGLYPNSHISDLLFWSDVESAEQVIEMITTWNEEAILEFIGSTSR